MCHSPPKEHRLTKRLEMKPRVTNDQVKYVGLDCQYIVNWTVSTKHRLWNEDCAEKCFSPVFF